MSKILEAWRCTFQKLQYLTSWGCENIWIHPNFLQLHSKTFDCKIPFTKILNLFLLPNKDQHQIFIVISLDLPIRQDQTYCHFLIFLFSKNKDIFFSFLKINLFIFREKKSTRQSKCREGQREEGREREDPQTPH